MESPEGRGLARRAWEAYRRTVHNVPGYDAYANAVNSAAAPVADPVARKVAAGTTIDLMGFWLTWQLDGGFEGLLRLGLSRASIYRKISAFRRYTGKHPDEFVMPGVHLILPEYQEAGSVAWAIRGPEPAELRAKATGDSGA